MTIRILIVEDQRIVREGLVAVLEDEDDLEVIGEASNGAEALECYPALLPDVVLMDLQMPVMDGPTAIAKLRAAHPEARILVLTTYATDEFIWTALRAGAQGYLLKDASGDQLASAIRAIQAGQTHLSPAVAARLVAGPTATNPEQLTPRELEVLRLLGRGRSNNEIALELTIAPRTVKVHVQNILGKLGATNRTEAVSIAVRQHIIVLKA